MQLKYQVDNLCRGVDFHWVAVEVDSMVPTRGGYAPLLSHVAQQDPDFTPFLTMAR